jgi:ketosteroid isomerase-like protein
MMQMTRRELTLAGALAATGSILEQRHAAQAEPADEAAVSQAVEALRKALLDKDKARLEQLTAGQLSYGHSDGRVQTQAEFVEGVMGRKALVKSLTFPDLKVSLAGDAAVARHTYASESETDGKPSSVRIGVLAVWQKQDGGWKLLARQGYKLA